MTERNTETAADLERQAIADHLNGQDDVRRHPHAPGRNDRIGISMMAAMRMFSTERKAEAWFEAQRWPDGVFCPYCGGKQIATPPRKKGRPRFRCMTRRNKKECGQAFSVKTDTIMHKSPLPLSKWGIAIYLFNTHLKSLSSMELHRDIEVTQKTAWHLAHRIREVWDDSKNPFKFEGPVEVDESYFGGKRSNLPKHKREAMPKGVHTEKGMVIGAKDRATGKIQTRVASKEEANAIRNFVHEHTAEGAEVYTDEAMAYRSVNRPHKTVNHGLHEYVKGDVHTNSIESHWSMLKRAHKGVFHHISIKHLPRYVAEFTGRHNSRSLDTEVLMSKMVSASVNRRLRYMDLIGNRRTRQPRMV